MIHPLHLTTDKACAVTELPSLLDKVEMMNFGGGGYVKVSHLIKQKSKKVMNLTIQDEILPSTISTSFSVVSNQPIIHSHQ